VHFLRTALVGILAALVFAVAASATGGTSLKIEKTPKLGNVLATAQGRTLYMFRADHGTTSACYGSCATYWPPLVTKAKPAAGAGVKAALLGTTKRKDGKLQVTYKGHPLYTYVGDSKSGQTTGEGLNLSGGKWYALAPSGAVIDRD
jgi:predicted lipoprotein with Yx(FWY)xxD motif